MQIKKSRWKSIIISSCGLLLLPLTTAISAAQTNLSNTQQQVLNPTTQTQTPNKESKGPVKRLWNLQDADIRAVIDAISNATGKNFLVDPRVQGKITIVSTTPMTNKEAYQVFLSSLQVLGFSAVQSGNVTKIVPSTSARSLNTPIASPTNPGSGDEPVVRVFNLSNVPASQLVPILRPLLPDWGSITAYTPSNSLVIAGDAGNVNRLVALAKNMDRQAASGTKIIHLNRASADKVFNVLTTLQNAERANGKVINVSFAADKQANSIVINGDPNSIRTYANLVTNLDKYGGSEATTKVIYLNYLKAKDFAPILAKIAGAEAPIAVSSPSSSSGSDSSSSNSSSSNGSASVSTSGGGGSSNSGVTIEAEPNTNAIIIKAPSAILANLTNVVHRLDRRPRQVLVEAVIAQVDESVLNSLGIQWGTQTSSSSTDSTGGTTTISGGFPPVGGQGIGVLSSGDLRAVINYLRTNSSTDILATPSIVVLDNQEASIEVGKTVSIETGSYANAGASDSSGSVNPFTTFDRQNVALILKVTPQISPNEAVRLTIDQKNDTLANPTSVSTQPVVNTAEIKTAALVKSGNIIVLGGLISHDLEGREEKVPVLGDIPLLGKLFQYHNKSIEKRNLMIFLRPVILNQGNTSTTANVNEISNERYNFIRDKQLKRREGEALIQTLHATPLLPAHGETRVDIPSPFGEPNGGNN